MGKSISSIYFTAIFRNQTVIDVHEIISTTSARIKTSEDGDDDDDGDGGRIYSARGVSIRECVRAWRLTSSYFRREKSGNIRQREVKETHTSGNNLFRAKLFLFLLLVEGNNERR